VINVQTRANDQPIQPTIRAAGGFQQDTPGLAAVKQQVVRPFIAHFNMVGQQTGHCLAQRRHVIVRLADGAVIARGLNHWVFVDTERGRPMTMPPEILETFDPSQWESEG